MSFGAGAVADWQSYGQSFQFSSVHIWKCDITLHKLCEMCLIHFIFEYNQYCVVLQPQSPANFCIRKHDTNCVGWVWSISFFNIIFIEVCQMGLVLQLQLILLLVLVINNDSQGYGKPSGFGSKGSKGRGLGRHLAILEKPYSLQGFQRFEYIIFSCIYDEFNDNFLL